MRRIAVGALVALLAATVAGCSVSLDDRPRDIPQEAQRPLEVRTEDVGDTSGSSRIFLVGPAQEGGRSLLRSVARDVPSNPNEALQALFAGPTQAETDAGYSTALPSGLELLSSPRTSGSILSIDVSGPLADLSGEDAILAVAQIVATVAEIDGVEQVRIRVEGAVRAWPDSDDEPVAPAGTPLTVYDYAELLGSAQPSYPAVPSD